MVLSKNKIKASLRRFLCLSGCAALGALVRHGALELREIRTRVPEEKLRSHLPAEGEFSLRGVF